MTRWSRRSLDTISPVRRFLWVVLLFALFTGVAEIALRLVDAKEVRNDIEYYIARTFTREEWKIASSIRDILLKVDRRPFCVKDTILYLYQPLETPYLTVNSDGIRGPEITPKEPGEYRIVITGASISYGLYFPDADTMPAVVETRLRERCPSCRVTVYNLGIEGYDLQRDIALVDRLFDKIRPDLVVFYAGGADVNYAYTWGYRKHEPFTVDGPFNQEQLKVVQQWYEKTWIDHSRVARLVLTAAKSERGLLPEPTRFDESFDPTLPPEFAERAAGFGRGFVNDMLMADIRLRERGADTLFVFMPDSVYKEPLSPLESSALKVFDAMYPHYGAFAVASLAAVRREVKEGRFERFRDLSDAFDGVNGDIFYDFIHMTPHGNRMLADRMFDLLIREGVLERIRAAATPSPSRPDRTPTP